MSSGVGTMLPIYVVAAGGGAAYPVGSAVCALVNAEPLTVCMAEDNPPFSMARKGQVTGFDVTVDGTEVARRIRAVLGRGEIMLIALTGYASPEDRRLTQDAGFDIHLVKPVDLDALRSALTRDA